MTSSRGLSDWSRLQAGRGVLQTTTDDDRRQLAKQYWPITRASNKEQEHAQSYEQHPYALYIASCFIITSYFRLCESPWIEVDCRVRCIMGPTATENENERTNQRTNERRHTFQSVAYSALPPSHTHTHTHTHTTLEASRPAKPWGIHKARVKCEGTKEYTWV